MTGIADTGFLVAFANRHDRHHKWAVEVALRIDEALLTCDAVLAEAAFHLQDSSLVLAMVRDGLVNPRLPVITTAVRDFRVYRRGRREIIPLLHPPRI